MDIELDGEPGEPGFAAALSAAILDAIDRAGEKRRSLERRAELEAEIAAKEAEIAGLRQQLEEI